MYQSLQMFDLPWELWRNWALVQGAILFVSWLVIKFGKIEEETEDKKENGEA